MSNFYQIQDVPQFQDLMKQDLQRVSVLNFWAPWAQPCAQMNEVFRELANKYERVLFLQASLASCL
jgi:thiol-disulfide isomerase/thioredoxin